MAWVALHYATGALSTPTLGSSAQQMQAQMQKRAFSGLNSLRQRCISDAATTEPGFPLELHCSRLTSLSKAFTF